MASTYVNPVLDTDFPDPTVIVARDGSCYAYSSQHTTTERWAYVPVARSSDLVRWEIVGDALPDRAPWTRSTWECAWGPHVIERRGTYYVYYAAMPDSRDGMCLGVATSATPDGPFLDSGEPIVCGPGYVCIDPMVFADPVSGRSYLYWGGDYRPIFAQELAPDLLRPAPGTAPIELLAPSDAPYERVLEGPFVTFRDGHYYLFYSGDRFGGDVANYAVMVARSRGPTGPFDRLAETTGRSSSAILERNDRWDAPGHCSVVTDAAGDDWIVYHAIDPTNRWNPGVRFVRRPMLIDRLVYRAGWPQVAHDAPSFTPRRAPRLARDVPHVPPSLPR